MFVDKLIVVAIVLLSFVVIAAALVSQPLSEETLVVEDGDCIYLSYIGRYCSNNTVFASSFEYPENRSGDTPYAAFITVEENKSSWHSSFTKIIFGLSEGILGMKEGQSKTIGPIPPSKAFFELPVVGDTFSSTIATYGSFVQEFEIVSFNESLDVYWKDVGEVGEKQFPPKYLFDVSSEPDFGFDVTGLISFSPPFDLFESGSVIANVSDFSVTYRLEENASLNLSPDNNIIEFQWGFFENERAFIFLGETEVVMHNETFDLLIDPPSTSPIFLMQGDEIVTLAVENLTDDVIVLTLTSEDENASVEWVEVPRVLTFDREVVIPRNYSIIPYYFEALNTNLADVGLGLGPYAGESVIYDVFVHKIYKNPN